jgi:hypothetical protein
MGLACVRLTLSGHKANGAVEERRNDRYAFPRDQTTDWICFVLLLLLYPTILRSIHSPLHPLSSRWKEHHDSRVQ